MDYSTLNVARIRSLPVYDPSLGYRLQGGSGNGCSGDPPGYPTYFTRSVYTSSGDNPRVGPQTVITLPDGKSYVVDDGNIDGESYQALLHDLWVPLPLDHPRTLLWIQATYRHYAHCYNGWRDDMVIFPVPSYKLRAYRDDPRWKDEFILAHRKEVDDWNATLVGKAREIATPENHNAVRIIRRGYPDYQPDLSLIANPPDTYPTQWWETEAEQPSEANCASSQRWGKKHPFASSRCQWCGREYNS